MFSFLMGPWSLFKYSPAQMIFLSSEKEGYLEFEKKAVFGSVIFIDTRSQISSDECRLNLIHEIQWNTQKN